MARMTAELNEVDVSALAAQINACGYCVVSNFLEPSALLDLQGYVRKLVAKSGGYVSLNGRAHFGACAMSELADDPAFGNLMRRLYVEGTGRPPPPLQFYQVLRCLVGAGARSHSMNFHFDSYVVTALIPLEIPGGNMRGDLIMFPNVRGIRRNYLLNAFDKLLLENRVTQRILRWLVRTNKIKYVRLSLVPGNLYVFWGYNSIHTNEECSASALRSTLLYHYANPHAASAINRRLKGVVHAS